MNWQGHRASLLCNIFKTHILLFLIGHLVTYINIIVPIGKSIFLTYEQLPNWVIQ